MSNAEESNLHDNAKSKDTQASICSPCSVKKRQPQPLCALLPPSMEACTVYEASQPIISISRSQENLKTTTVHTEPIDGVGKDTTLLLITHLSQYLLNLFPLTGASLLLSAFPFHETSVHHSFWRACSATHWTVYWPRWEAAKHVFALCAAANPSSTIVTSVAVWVFTISCVIVPSVTSAFRLQSVWT